MMTASLLTAVLFGLAPAFRATQVEAAPALKETAGALSGGRPGALLGRVLVVSQVALSLVLVAGAGLFVGSLRNLKTLDAGFNRENVLQAAVNPGKAGYKGAQLSGFYEQLLERVKQIPGVRSASLSWFTPIAGGGVDLPASIEGYTPQPNEDNMVYVNNVSPNYLETLGTALLLGRDFTARDTQNTPKVALINETMAKYYFQGANPLGRRVTLEGRDPMEIIGVVKDAKISMAP
jgi:ABC-type antimicrobial peptide transport system permease subunit